MAESDLEETKRQIEALSPPDKLRLAAELLELRDLRKTKIAHAIAEKVVLELGAALALRAMDVAEGRRD